MTMDEQILREIGELNRNIAELRAAIMKRSEREDALLLTEEAAAFFRCSPDRVLAMEKEGLPYFTGLGKGHRYQLSDLVKFARSRREIFDHVDRDLLPSGERIRQVVNSVLTKKKEMSICLLTIKC